MESVEHDKLSEGTAATVVAGAASALHGRSRGGAGSVTLAPRTPLNAAVESAMEDAWAAFWATRDLEARNELIVAYRGVVERVVSHLPSSIREYWDAEDLKSFGTLGLIEAIERFDKESVVPRFPAYASTRVRGAVFDELRRLDWLPRTVRRRVISYRTTVDTLSNELRRPPSRDEVFASMDVKASDGAALLVEVQSAQLLHLDHAGPRNDDGDDDHAPLSSRITSGFENDPEPAFLASEELDELREAISSLPERQRTVVTLHFLAGLTQGQIGDMLGISNSRVCQIEATAMQRPRQVLERTRTAQVG
jgi:RNA polymerase sigma factor for flagellar operon FliA